MLKQGPPQVEDDPLADLRAEVALEHPDQAVGDRDADHAQRQQVQQAEIAPRKSHVDQLAIEQRRDQREQRDPEDRQEHEHDAPEVGAGVAGHASQDRPAHGRPILLLVVPNVRPPSPVDHVESSPHALLRPLYGSVCSAPRINEILTGDLAASP